MELILKQYDIPLLRFSATNDSSTPEIEVHWINEDQRHLLPLDMELSPEGISRWMRWSAESGTMFCKSCGKKHRKNTRNTRRNRYEKNYILPI